jgi:peptidoglycan pentaglycine glycine transferase (the first glycine)
MSDYMMRLPLMRRPAQVTSSYATREARGVGREEWDGWLGRSPGGGHMLQSYRWGEFKRRLGWRPIRLVLERGGEVAGVGQFLVRATLPVPGVLMYCTKGPWLPWDDEEAVRVFFRGVVEVAAREGAHTVKIEPEVPEGHEGVKATLREIGFRKARYDLNFGNTAIVDLSPSEEELLARMKAKTRYNARLAARKGVEVVEPEDFGEAFETFYSWMRGLAERKEGFHMVRPREYFYDVMRTMHEAGQGRFFFATHDGEPLAGIYVVTSAQKCWYMYGASGTKKRNLMPNYLLHWEGMKWAKRRGIAHYDMGSVPKLEDRNEDDPYYGVYKFKAGFGVEEVEFLGCLDLPVGRARAAAWYKLEPLYYRLYQRLKGNVFY